MRSHYCGQLNEQHVGQEVSLCGWAHRRRDHGGVIFVDLRDREGIVQVVFDPDRPESFALAESVRSEFVLQVKGLVRLRPQGTSNAEMGTGRSEVLAKDLVILSVAKTPPFLLDEQGFTVVPITAISLEYSVSTEYISTGVPKLDLMMGGKGYYRGGTLLITGTAGSGKTSLAAHFADAACGRGERCLYFLFEESPEQFMRNMRSIGIDLQRWVVRISKLAR